MAEEKLTIKMVADVENVTATVERMAAYFMTAPDDDAVKLEMVRFGEIDPVVHCPVKAEYSDGQIVVTCSLSPELQRIADMVPG